MILDIRAKGKMEHILLKLYVVNKRDMLISTKFML